MFKERMRFPSFATIGFSLMCWGFAGGTFLSVSVLSSSCASAPVSTARGVSAFNNTRVVKTLDLIRDLAISANSQNPPELSTQTTRKIVQFHQSSLVVIRASVSGWQAAVVAGLDEALKDLPAKESRLLSPYAQLAKTVIQEVSR